MQSFFLNNRVGSLYPICTQHELTCYYGNMEKDVRLIVPNGQLSKHFVNLYLQIILHSHYLYFVKH
jgi:hypothetical protein